LRRLAVAIPFGLVVGVAVALLSNRAPIDAAGDRSLLASVGAQSVTGRVTMTDTMQLIDRTVRVGATDKGLVLDETPFECHGGRARALWYVGNLEPTVAQTGIHLAARLDGETVGALIRGSAQGLYNDGPISLATAFYCPAGHHTLDIQVLSVEGWWGIPYVANVPDIGYPINRGFIVTEVWE
jgi:hypothetical protein